MDFRREPKYWSPRPPDLTPLCSSVRVFVYDTKCVFTHKCPKIWQTGTCDSRYIWISWNIRIERCVNGMQADLRITNSVTDKNNTKFECKNLISARNLLLIYHV